MKRVLGGLLVQDRDAEIEERDGWQAVVRRARRAPVGRPRLRVARLQARLVERDRAREGPATIGIGAGQMSRVDAVKIAVEKAREHGHDVTGAVLASDAFFPFADGPQLALDAA